ncbi:MAG: MFS transporter [Xanthobacteraceae bacterium]|nr:MFS transporter [Xanthobacteraceae bacterium]
MKQEALAEQDEPVIQTRALPKFLSGRRALTIILCAMYCLFYLDRVNLSQAASSIAKDFNLTNTQLGVAFSAFSLTYMIGQAGGGWFARRYGARAVLTICAICVGIATIMTGMVGGLSSLVAARLLVGLGEGPAFATATHAMRNWYPLNQFGWIQGITHSFARLGGAIAPPIVAALIVAHSWHFSFLVFGVVSLVWGLAWWMFFRDDPRTHHSITREELASLPPASGATKDPTPFGAILYRVLPLTAVFFCYAWILWMFLSWMPLYFQHKYNQTLGWSATLSGLLLFGGVIGDTIGGIISDKLLERTGKRWIARSSLIAFALTTCAAFTGLAMLANDIRYVIPLLAVGYFFLELLVAPLWCVPMDITREHSGLLSGLMNVGVGLAGTISPIVFGYMIDRTGNWDLPFVSAIGVLLAGAVICIFMRPDHPLTETDR